MDSESFLGLGVSSGPFLGASSGPFLGPRVSSKLLWLLASSEPFLGLGASSGPFLGFWTSSHLFWASGPLLGLF